MPRLLRGRSRRREPDHPPGRRSARAVLVGALAAALLLTGCTSNPDAAGNEVAENRFVAGEGVTQVFPAADRPAAPKVTGDLLAGGTFDLAALRGKVVVVNYWASWCAPCRLEAPELNSVYEKQRADGVEFVGINIRDDKDKALAFEKRFKITYPSVFDPPGRIALRFAEAPPTTIPSTIVIDREGRIAAVFRKSLLADELAPVVRDVAAER